MFTEVQCHDAWRLLDEIGKSVDVVPKKQFADTSTDMWVCIVESYN